MSGTSRVGALWPALLAVAAAEGGRRLLSPAPPPAAPVRVDLGTYFSPAEIDRGRRFARPQLALALTRGAIELAALGALVGKPPAVLRRRSRRSEADGAAVGAGLSLALSVPGLPLRVLARRRSIAVGLDTQTWRAWAGDLAKMSAIQTVFAAGGGALVTAATRRYPRGWWVPAAAGSVLFGAVMAALAPVVLDPLFNTFEPLPVGQTRSDVLALAADAGVKVGEVYSVDASRRTTAANAYVSGLGPTKRVVLYDTLLDRYGRDEIRLVVAHELGHVRHRDVPRGVLYAAIVAPAAALAVQRLSGALSPERGTAAALPALALAASLVSAPIGASGNRLSRAIERRADHFSLTLAGAPEAFVSFERTIALQNVADLDPPRWVSRLLASHPPTAERIGAAVAFGQAHPG
ncbi:MAG TPA: M48 family metalloprotease [Solirubrobacteraceae bacterium]|nr:M48 family metalloprotease [Solirubrobacteraceae bacterium]